MQATNATIETNYGNIEIELDVTNTPITCENFIKYAKNGHYENTLFHRVIDGFMIQGGGLNLDMSDKPTEDSIENEADKGTKNDTGTIAMARTNDPHSATSQFFINVNDNNFLNFKAKNSQGWGYCVFGKVISGMETVNKIKKVKTTTKHYHQDVPVDDVVINKVTVNQ
ncbi:MAG: peptidylprolyl isomerase [Gammaproteobacteria bacterium]|nr:peptidylprolyl isomerase [Gammaproteobacteria bacterium]